MLARTWVDGVVPGAEDDLSLPSSTVASFRSSSNELSEETDDDWRRKGTVYYIAYHMRYLDEITLH